MPMIDLDALEQALVRLYTYYGSFDKLTIREFARQIDDELTRVESLTMTERITDETFKVPPDGEPRS